MSVLIEKRKVRKRSSENNCVCTLIEYNKFYIWKYKSTMKIWLLTTTLQES